MCGWSMRFWAGRKRNCPDIKTVYSHPQALMQCSEYLNARKDWSQISVLNAAVAAKKVMEEKDKSQAAVASRTAGELYGLKELAVEINNAKGNTTRFLALANRPIYEKRARPKSALRLKFLISAVPFTTFWETLFSTASTW